MSPIPLRDPDGNIRAYACDRCSAIHAGSELYSSIRGIKLTAARLELAQENAQACCRCRKCGRPEDKKVLTSTSPLGAYGLCKQCRVGAAKASNLEHRRYKVSQRAFNAEYQRRMALAKDWDIACHLVGMIRNLSDEHWFANWSTGVEFELWRQMLEGGIDLAKTDETTCMQICNSEAAKLRRLSRRCGGWWMMWTEPKGCKGQHARGEVFVPLAEWKAIFKEHESKKDD